MMWYKKKSVCYLPLVVFFSLFIYLSIFRAAYFQFLVVLLFYERYVSKLEMEAPVHDRMQEK